MKTKIKVLAGIGIATVVALALIVGGWFVNNAYAQAPTPNPNLNVPYGAPALAPLRAVQACHNNQAVLDLLKASANDLLAQRQAGKSLLDIAAAKGVSEQQLTDALLQPITTMQGWMGQSQIPEAQRRGNYPQSNAQQMTQYMRDWIAKDIRVAQYGTMTDLRLFGGPGAGMMGNWNGSNSYGGMMNGWSGSNSGNGYGGMMGGTGTNGFRGMTGGRTN